MNETAQAWMRAFAYGEGTYDTKTGELQYKKRFGGKLDVDTSKPHTSKVIGGGNRYASAAAGFGQFMPTTWIEINNGVNVPMTPENQERAFYKLALRRGVDITKDAFTANNVAKLSPEWASVPMLNGKSYYGQPVKSFKSMEAIFKKHKPSSFVQQASAKLTELYPNVKPGPAKNLQIKPTEKKHPLSILGFK